MLSRTVLAASPLRSPPAFPCPRRGMRPHQKSWSPPRAWRADRRRHPGRRVSDHAHRHRRQRRQRPARSAAPAAGCGSVPHRRRRAAGPACSCAAAIPNNVLMLVDSVRVASAVHRRLRLEQLPLDAVGRVGIVRGLRQLLGIGRHGRRDQIFTRRLEGPRLACARQPTATPGQRRHGRSAGREGFSVQAGLPPPARLLGHQCRPVQWPGRSLLQLRSRQTTATVGGKNLAHGARCASAASASPPACCATTPKSPTTEAVPSPSSRQRPSTSKAISSRDGATASDSASIGKTCAHRISVRSSSVAAPACPGPTRCNLALGSSSWVNLDLLHERGENRDLYAGSALYRDRRDNSAVFAGWQAHAGAWNGKGRALRRQQKRVRRPHHRQRRGRPDTSERSRLTASVGSAFHGPNLNEQFNPGYGGYYAGNPDLQPGVAHGRAVPGLASRRRAELGDACLPLARVRNLIAYTGSKNRAENTAHAQIDGVELSRPAPGRLARRRQHHLAGRARHRQRHRTIAPPRHKLAATLERQFSADLSLGAELQAVGRRRTTAPTWAATHC